MSLPPGIKEAFIGPLFENIIYGLYLSASIECWRLFRKKKARDAKHIYLMTTSALMFILITMRCIIDTYRLIAAFNTPGLNFGQLNNIPGTVTNICLILVNIIADMFMIFRTFIVWNRRWTIIIIPVLLCVTNIGMGVWTMTVTIRSVTTGDAALESLLPETISIFFAVTLATNLACTGLIAFRIIHAHLQLTGMGVQTSGKGHSQSLRILSVLVESAAIYTLILIPILICARVGTFTIYILLDMTAPTIGLVFSFIIIAVSRGTSYGENTTNATTTSLSDFRIRRPHEFDQSFSTRSATRPEVHIQLEHAHSNSEPERSSRDDCLHLAKYSPTKAV
ncbi:hypothetical protein DFH08DRAFT_933866 [Mycena albidolilacea]|uniref:Uncharacterized protein n=1 Tax=Mycena albidolilacea TaxID=1033008 RepID=A0AAD7ABP5_9AGAR|nr:hypothetical protein DFH08DRAFT_933866 [Mycena albidolilacea]